jgi:hypothetical protein
MKTRILKKGGRWMCGHFFDKDKPYTMNVCADLSIFQFRFGAIHGHQLDRTKQSILHLYTTVLTEQNYQGISYLISKKK